MLFDGLLLLILFLIFLVYIFIVFYCIFAIYREANKVIDEIYEITMRSIDDGTYVFGSSSEMYARRNEINKLHPYFEYLVWRPVKYLYDMDYIINGRKKNV